MRTNGALISFSNPDNATTTVPTWSQRYTAFIKTVRLCSAVSVYDQAVFAIKCLQRSVQLAFVTQC